VNTHNVLEISGLSVRLGKSLIIDDLSLTLGSRGSVVGLFGPNGAGKTTLIRCVCRQINSYSGTIDVPPGDTICYLPDAPFLDGFLRLSDCVDLYQDLFRDFDSAIARDIFDRLGLNVSKRISECSKGMSEQTHLALALARRSALYILDEPLASVDPLTRDDLIDMIATYRMPGSSVVLSTHLIQGVESLFDEMVVLHRGKVVLQGKVDELQAEGRGLEGRFKEVIREQTLAR